MSFWALALDNEVKRLVPNATPIIPKVSFKKEWSNSDLYQYFNFNQAEINHIEEVIK